MVQSVRICNLNLQKGQNRENLTKEITNMFFSFHEIVLLFFIYSFLGWCVEVAFVAITLGTVVNRGFLNGPVCPIYGCGMLGVLMVLLPVKQDVFLLFLGGMLICSAVELFGGWILDKIFHMRWWDYSDRPFNVGGYICLPFSIMWGFAVVLAVWFVHAPIMAVVGRIPYAAQIVIIIIFGIMFMIDMIVTLKHLIGIKKSLGQLDRIAGDLHSIGDQLKDVVGNSAIGVADKAGQGRERIGEATIQTKEKIVTAMEGGREKIALVAEERRERKEEAAERRENIEETAMERRKKLQNRKDELEKLRTQYMEKVYKNAKYIRNSLVALNKSGKSIKILEYLKDMRKESKED